MGLLSKLGGAIKEGVRNGATNALLKATGNNSMTGDGTNGAAYEYDANGNIKGVNSKYVSEVAMQYAGYQSAKLQNIDGNFGSLLNSTPRSVPSSYIDYPKKYGSTPSGLLLNDRGSDTIENYSSFKTASDPKSDIYQFKLPDWTYADFINERSIWQKGLSSIFDEPAWFYFKIFFDFKTNHGLFGGLLNSDYLTSATNSAAKYLYTVRKFHKQEKPKDRINALYKFASILSYINTNAPWYFKSIKNLNNAALPVIDEYSKERFIEIDTLPDSIDMRLSTLMSLYSYACYDTLLGKEIIPENLRKFNMTIIVFQTPLRYLHTSYITNKKMEYMGVNLTGLANMFGRKNNNFEMIKYKSMNPSDGESGNFQNTMSMHAFTFYGCEFDIQSLGNMIPSEMSNERPFQLGSNTIKITYKSCTQHTMNEFYAMMYGSDGFYFNQYSNFQLNDWNGYVNANTTSWNKQLGRYKALSDLFENIIGSGTILGLVNNPTTYKRAIDATEAIMNGLYEDNNILKDLGTNFALGLLGSSKSTDAPQGNIYGDYGINSAYFKDKVNMLKNGVHERTQAPYYYDPYTGVKKDLHKDRNYTAYNFKNDVDIIKQFNVNNWLQTNTQKAASKLNDGLRDLFNNESDFVQNPYLADNGQITNKNYKINEPGFVKAGEKGKTQVMVDNPNNWRMVEKPYKYESNKAVDYEYNKALSSTNNDNKQQIGIQEALKEQEFKLVGSPGKNIIMTDKRGNPEHEHTKAPFKYDSENAVKYEENKKANT